MFKVRIKTQSLLISLELWRFACKNIQWRISRIVRNKLTLNRYQIPMHSQKRIIKISKDD